MRKFLKFVHDDNVYCKYYEVFYILFHTGLRISEFCGLTIKDLDMKNRIINIDHQLQRLNNMEYHIESTEFVLPALSVQPLVENAIKHGLMRLETGGTVKIHSYETPTHFCVAVTDDGVGFDPEAPIDGKKHVGLRNIRGRLKAMVNGDLVLESTPGAGTKATIIIPKEVTV